MPMMTTMDGEVMAIMAGDIMVITANTIIPNPQWTITMLDHQFTIIRHNRQSFIIRRRKSVIIPNNPGIKATRIRGPRKVWRAGL